MRCLLVGVLVLGACNADPTRYPVNPGGGGGPPGLSGGVRDPGDDDDSPVDAPVTGGDGGSDAPLPLNFAGRACQITDLRQPRANCSTTAAGMISVRMVGAQRSSDETAMDGTFTVGGPPMPLQYVLSRVDDIETIAPFRDATNQVMPFLTATAYDTLLAANGLNGGGGAFVIEIVDAAGMPITGATVAAVGSTTLYDANDALVWAQNASTGPRGVAWVPQQPAGQQQLVINPNNGKPAKNVTLESFDSRTITHHIVEFP